MFSGAGEYGQRSVLDQAEEYVECARENFVMFQPPEVILGKHADCQTFELSPHKS